MKLAPLAASILGCAWLLISATDSPNTLLDSNREEVATKQSPSKLLPPQTADSTAGNIIPYEKDSTTSLKVSIVPID